MTAKDVWGYVTSGLARAESWGSYLALSPIRVNSRTCCLPSFSEISLSEFVESPLQFYKDHDPLATCCIVCVLAIIHCYVAERWTRNASQVDRLWTVMPTLYTLLYAVHPYAANNPKVYLLTYLVICWCLRLSYNTYRRGLFKADSEDYRWQVVREEMTPTQWTLLNIFFVCIGQHVLLLALTLPIHALLCIGQYRGSPLGMIPTADLSLTRSDIVLACLFMLNLVIQFTADQQQWNYQNMKRGNAKKSLSAKDTQRKNRGFIREGLWAWSRHPNFACEQMTWWFVYAFVPFTLSYQRKGVFGRAVGHGGHKEDIVNYTLLGPLALSLLFYMSTRLTERISASKYPEYTDYQREVGMFWPEITLLKKIYHNFVIENNHVEKED